jgi:PIN domain nuclease of toxin-antitoxin system
VRLLLDTHIVLALLNNTHAALPRAMESLFFSGENDLYTSAASTWEVAIKHRLGKLPLPCPLSEWTNIVNLIGILNLPLVDVHALTAADPLPATKDPFDRILLSICAAENLRLVTIDKKLRDHPLAWRA